MDAEEEEEDDAGDDPERAFDRVGRIGLFKAKLMQDMNSIDAGKDPEIPRQTKPVALRASRERLGRE